MLWQYSLITENREKMEVFQWTMYLKIFNYICALVLPKEPYRSTILSKQTADGSATDIVITFTHLFRLMHIFLENSSIS